MTTPAPTEERCTWSDLFISQCAHCRGLKLELPAYTRCTGCDKQIRTSVDGLDLCPNCLPEALDHYPGAP
jgi:hypothetical protein